MKTKPKKKDKPHGKPNGGTTQHQIDALAANRWKGQIALQKKRALAEKKFAEAYSTNGGDKLQAYEKAKGYAPSPDKKVTAQRSKVAGSWTKKESILALIEKTDALIVAEAPNSIHTLAELRDSSDSERIRIQASKALMDSYADVETKRVRIEANQVSVKQTNNILIANLSDEDIKERIAKLVGAGSIVYGADAEEVKGGINVSDGGGSGLQEPSTIPQKPQH